VARVGVSVMVQAVVIAPAALPTPERLAAAVVHLLVVVVLVLFAEELLLTTRIGPAVAHLLLRIQPHCIVPLLPPLLLLLLPLILRLLLLLLRPELLELQLDIGIVVSQAAVGPEKLLSMLLSITVLKMGILSSAAILRAFAMVELLTCATNSNLTKSPRHWPMGSQRLTSGARPKLIGVAHAMNGLSLRPQLVGKDSSFK